MIVLFCYNNKKKRKEEDNMSAVSDKVRTMLKEGEDIRDTGLSTPETIRRYDDIVYGKDPKMQSLDVYVPKDAEGKMPVIVSVHGGGWVYGDKERYQYYCMDLATRGFAVVNFTYRLAPEAKFPASMEDTNLVFHWVMDHADEYGFDTDNIFAVGDSAGGHMLGLYCNMCTNPEYAKKYDFSVPQGFVPKAVGLNCGAYEIILGKQDLTGALMGDFLPEGGTEAELDAINVLKHMTEEFPPCFVMSAIDDFLKEDSIKIVNRLVGLGVPFTYQVYGDKDHRLAHVFHLNIRTDDAVTLNDAQAAFFRKKMEH